MLHKKNRNNGVFSNQTIALQVKLERSVLTELEE
jgi:hypothetical protein